MWNYRRVNICCVTNLFFFYAIWLFSRNFKFSRSLHDQKKKSWYDFWKNFNTLWVLCRTFQWSTERLVGSHRRTKMWRSEILRVGRGVLGSFTVGVGVRKGVTTFGWRRGGWNLLEQTDCRWAIAASLSWYRKGARRNCIWCAYSDTLVSEPKVCDFIEFLLFVCFLIGVVVTGIIVSEAAILEIIVIYCVWNASIK